MDEKFKILSMIDISHSMDSFSILEHVADVAHEKPDRDLLINMIGRFDVHLCSLRIRIDRRVIDSAGKCRAIFTSSTGTDHIDVEYARQKGIQVISIKNDYEFLKDVTATSEQAWALLLGVLRKIPWAFDAVKKGDWGRDRFIGHSLSGKVFGILGYGRLGKVVGRYAKAFGMKVIACDIKSIDSTEVTQVSFDELISRSDIISIHVHLTSKTKHLINNESFSKMKEGVVVINTSRGAVIDESVFINALKTGKVSAAGIDVIDGEWRADVKEHPLVAYAREHDNLLISPHVGGVTYESQRMALEHTLYKIREYIMSFHMLYS